MYDQDSVPEAYSVILMHVPLGEFDRSIRFSALGRFLTLSDNIGMCFTWEDRRTACILYDVAKKEAWATWISGTEHCCSLWKKYDGMWGCWISVPRPAARSFVQLWTDHEATAQQKNIRRGRNVVSWQLTSKQFGHIPLSLFLQLKYVLWSLRQEIFLHFLNRLSEQRWPRG